MSEDPLGDLERELVAAARRRAQGPRVARRAHATGGALAVASAGFALIPVLAVMLLVAGR